jgi:cytochrome c biogenesis protein CcdA
LESLPEFAMIIEALKAPLAVEGWFLIAFAVGLLHAFDADHVMALSVFATEEATEEASEEPRANEAIHSSARSGVSSGVSRDVPRGLRIGLRWALGHGVVLMLVGAVFVVLGQSMPQAWSQVAERVVGGVMIFLGISALIRLYRQRSHVHFHQHDGLQSHAHWHSHQGEAAHPGLNRHHHEHVPATHGPSLIGALHGLAGSAPILALLPASAESPARGFTYLLLFGLGVAVAMAVASGAMAYVAGSLSRSRSKNAFTGMRLASAAGSISIGLWLGLGG